MDHLFHIFMPGTPENVALASQMPNLALALTQLQVWWTALRKRWT